MKDKSVKSFSLLAWAAVGVIAFNLYKLYNASRSPEGLQGVFQTELRDIIGLILIALFLFFYYKKSILSWWIIPLLGPFLWIFHYLQHPFELKPFLCMFFIWILVCFFIVRKYEDYKSFIKWRRSR